MRREKEKGIHPRLKLILVFLAVVLAGTAIGLLFTPVFHIEEAYCEGCVRMTQEEVLGVAQVENGKNIFLQNLSEIKKRVSDMPMVEEASVRRVFPNKIKIWIKERIPAAYLYTGSSCAVVDVDGKILEMINDGRVEKLIAENTPKKPVKETDKKGEGEEEKTEPSGTAKPTDSAKPSASPAPSGSAKPTDSAKPSASPAPSGLAEPADSAKPSASPEDPETSGQSAEKTEDQEGESLLPYTIPLVVGLELEQPEPGKTAESREREKLGKTLETFRDLEKAGLLVRATYLDVSDLQDVTLVIENRLEIQLGALENMAYRSAFLAKIIDEKISATEHAIMDYRGDDVYVRQPEDGKARMVPKPKASGAPGGSAKPKESALPKKSDSPKESASPGKTDTPAASAPSGTSKKAE